MDHFLEQIVNEVHQRIKRNQSRLRFVTLLDKRNISKFVVNYREVFFSLSVPFFGPDFSLPVVVFVNVAAVQII